jgi:hypothetical protein
MFVELTMMIGVIARGFIVAAVSAVMPVIVPVPVVVLMSVTIIATAVSMIVPMAVPVIMSGVITIVRIVACAVIMAVHIICQGGVSKYIKEVKHYHIRVERLIECVFDPVIRRPAYIDEQVAGRYLHDVTDRGLIVVQVEPAVEQQGQFHIMCPAAEYLADPIMVRKDSADYVEAVAR